MKEQFEFRSSPGRILKMTRITFPPKTPNQTVRNHLPNQDRFMPPPIPQPTTEKLQHRLGHNPLNPKHAKYHGPEIHSHGTMQKEVIHTLPTPLAHTAPILNNETPLSQIICSESLPQRSIPGEKGNTRWDLSLPNKVAG